MPSVYQPTISDFDEGMAEALGVEALFMFEPSTGRVRDFITKQTLAISSIGVGLSEEGPVLTFAGGSSQFLSFTGISSALKTGALDQFIVCGRIKATAAQVGAQGVFIGLTDGNFTNSGVGVCFDNNAAPKPSGYVMGANGAFAASPISGVLNTFYTVYCNGAQGNQSARAWVNGALTTTVLNSGGTSTTPTEITLGAIRRGTGVIRYATGQMLWGAVLKRSLATGGAAAFSNGDAWNLYSNDFPYNLFRRTRRNYPAAAAAASASMLYQPAAAFNHMMVR